MLVSSSLVKTIQDHCEEQTSISYYSYMTCFNVCPCMVLNFFEFLIGFFLFLRVQTICAIFCDFLRSLSKPFSIFFFFKVKMCYLKIVWYIQYIGIVLHTYKVKISLCGNHFTRKEHIKQDKSNIFVSIKFNIFSFLL